MAEAWLWSAWQWARHPVSSYRVARKWRRHPKAGDVVTDCRGKTLHIASVDPEDEDTLILEDGSRASWMHCCGYPGEE